MAGNELSTLNGCFVPCLLTILGAVLFLRLGFAVGMMGMWGALGILLFSEVVSCITITSFSAIASNGRMQGGGAYLMISRNLGPALGGASGLLFWITYSLNATFNVVAFVDVIQETFFPEGTWWRDGRWSGVVLSSLSLLPLLAVAYTGAGTFAKVNALVFAGLLVACLVTSASLFFSQESFTFSGQPGQTYTPFNTHTLQENFWPDPVVSDQCASAGAFGMQKTVDQPCSLQLVFSVIFPAVVGMMEGLNLSGDLKKPERSIPLGTFWAVFVAFIIYVLLLVGQAGTMSREALQANMNVLQQSTWGGGYFVVLGVATACLSTVLGSLFGAARILQAMARDDMFPGMAVFKAGTPEGDEPRPAILMSYVIAQAGLFLGSLDDVAPLLTNFFLLTYSLTDLSCVLLEFAKMPNFRPTFRFYRWQTSLLNSIVVVAVMFYLNWIYAVCTILCFAVILVYLSIRFDGQQGWVDISQALLFRVNRRSLLKMQRRGRDLKHWRPSLLLLAPFKPLSEEPSFLHLASFLNGLKQSGIFVIGQAYIGDQLPPGALDAISDQPQPASPRRLAHAEVAKSIPGFEGFLQLACGPSGRLACTNLLIGTGLGALAPDTAVLPMLQTFEATPELTSEVSAAFRPPVSGAEEFVQVLRDIVAFRKNAIVAANFRGGESASGLYARRVDVWLFGPDLRPPPAACCTRPGSRGAAESVAAGADGRAGGGGPGFDKECECQASADMVVQMSLLLQLGFLATAGTGLRLRLLHAGDGDASPKERETVMRQWLEWARIKRGEVQAVPLAASATSQPSSGSLGVDGQPSLDDARSLAKHMRRESGDAQVVLALLPLLPESCGGSAHDYMRDVRELTTGLPPTLLVRNGQGLPVITTSI